MPKVSVLAPLYNHERFVAAAIESVLAQTFQDWELLIWDDGSSDRSLEIAKEFANRDRRIKVHVHPGEANLGQEATRNAALKEAKGELISLLDTDDLFEPKKLELLVPCFADSGIVLAYGKSVHLNHATGDRTEPSGVRRSKGFVFDQLVNDNFIEACAVLFRKTAIQGTGFDVRYRTIGEYPLWLELSLRGQVEFVDEIVAVWRDHGENTGTRLALQAKRELVEFKRSLLSVPSNVSHAVAIRRAIAKAEYDYASELHSRGDLKSVRAPARAALSETCGDVAVRAKAGALWATTFLGERASRTIAKAKREFWRMRQGKRG